MKDTKFCTICDKTFKTLQNLQLHVARVHANLKNNINLKQSVKTKSKKMPYLCRFCKKIFIHKGHWEEHERIHTNERPFLCDVCKKSFKTKNTLTLHERTHTGEKPYSCKYCSKAFNQSSNLAKHELIHTGEKPYPCK